MIVPLARPGRPPRGGHCNRSRSRSLPRSRRCLPAWLIGRATRSTTSYSNACSPRVCSHRRRPIGGDVLFPADPRATVALGFLAAGPWDESSLRDIREDSIDRKAGQYLDRDDMVGTVGLAMLSTTVQCARCHDHKFDPVSQKEYYGLQAGFAGVDGANRPYDADPAVRAKRQARTARKHVLQAGPTA